MQFDRPHQGGIISVVLGTTSTATCSGLPRRCGPRSSFAWVASHGKLSRRVGSSAAELVAEAARLPTAHARLSGAGAAVPSAGRCDQRRLCYLEVKCLGCNTHQTVALNIVRRSKATPIHKLERYMRCKDCSRLQGRPFKRSHLVALRTTKMTASDPASSWWPGERD